MHCLRYSIQPNFLILLMDWSLRAGFDVLIFECVDCTWTKSIDYLSIIYSLQDLKLLTIYC